jgi:hypothetical protein
MNRIVVTLCLAAMALGSPAAAQPAAGATAPASDAAVLTAKDVIWVRKPSGGDLEEALKKYASGYSASGDFWVRCTIAESGDLTGCRVVRATSAEPHMLRAILAMSARFRAKTTNAAGDSVVGRQVEVPIRLHMG